MTKIKEFIDSIEVENTAKVVKHVLDGVDVKLETFTVRKLEKFVLDRKPNSPKSIATICYVIGLYAKWLDSQNSGDGTKLLELVQNLDKKKLWKKAKPTARKKFVTHADFKRVIKEIELYEEFNDLYYSTLFRCVYEGIYCDDMSVIKNLRGSDVHGSTVVLHEDNGHTYKFKITPQLAADIVELSRKQIWERRNRYGICKVDMRGLYPDSVFKVEERKSANPEDDSSLRFCYYAKLRKISDEYLDNHILPFQLYISGIMHRIASKLKRKNITIKEALAENNRNRDDHMIIEAELVRCNYGSEYGNFKDIVKGHLDMFDMSK